MNRCQICNKLCKKSETECQKCREKKTDEIPKNEEEGVIDIKTINWVTQQNLPEPENPSYIAQIKSFLEKLFK